MREVTAAIITRGERVLICRRSKGKRFAGKWEFPGGKLEENETLADCLRRELREELGFDARVGEIFDARTDGEFRIMYFFAEIASGTPTALEHSEIKWVSAAELPEYDFPEGDREVAMRLVRRLRQ